MKMDKAKVDQFIKWLKEKWSNGQKCPICLHDDWFVGDQLFELKENEPEIPQTPSIMPVASVICKNCGHTVFFNALHIKLMDIPKQGGQNG
jgi:hypothetical protein